MLTICFRIKKDKKTSGRQRRKSEVEKELENERRIVEGWSEGDKKKRMQKLLERKARKIIHAQGEKMKADKYILE